MAWASALLWAVDPLQTESVTYISQRAESLMGLWYLLTVYSFVRFAGAGTAVSRRPVWAAVSVGSCLLGMATKEVMATAPLVIFIYDRLFLSGSWSGAWRARRGYYVGLGLTWILLGVLVAGTGGRGGTAGFGSGVAWWAYAVTQFRAIALYLKLSVWPHPLLFSYGLILGDAPWLLALNVVLVLGLIAISLVQAARGRPWAFLGIWFFGILAPTSSVIPVSTELIAEHRAYLSLAAVTTLVALGGYTAITALGRTLGLKRPVVTGLMLAAVSLAAAGSAWATFVHNRVYSSTYALWADTVEKSPRDAGARNNLGNALSELGRNDEAEVQFRESLRLAPAYGSPHQNLGNVLMKLGRPAAAVPEYRQALVAYPDNAAVHYQLGDALRKSGQASEAQREFGQALQGKSESSVVWFDLGNALLDASRLPEAEKAFANAIAHRPDYTDALVDHAGILAQEGRVPEAIAEFRRVAQLQPAAADVHNDLGSMLAENGQLPEARAEFEEALRLKPDYREARDNLERVKAMQTRAGGS